MLTELLRLAAVIYIAGEQNGYGGGQLADFPGEDCWSRHLVGYIMAIPGGRSNSVPSGLI